MGKRGKRRGGQISAPFRKREKAEGGRFPRRERVRKTTFDRRSKLPLHGFARLHRGGVTGRDCLVYGVCWVQLYHPVPTRP
jgi:hypothetical protein